MEERPWSRRILRLVEHLSGESCGTRPEKEQLRWVRNALGIWQLQCAGAEQSHRQDPDSSPTSSSCSSSSARATHFEKTIVDRLSPESHGPTCSCSRCSGSQPSGLDSVQCGNVRHVLEFSKDELSKFDGTNGRPIYLALKKVVYDVTKGAAFYGPGGGYSVLAGKEADRALAKMSLADEDVGSTDLHGLSEKQLENLETWIQRMQAKYPIVGTLV